MVWKTRSILTVVIAGLIATMGYARWSADDGFVDIPGGSFLMGSDRYRPEETPIQNVTVSGFRISRTEVTNSQFAEFVADTGYITTAEKGLDPESHPNVPDALRVPGSMVFAQPAQHVDLDNPNLWWRYVQGANWRQPTGPGSSIDGMDDHPVVQVSPEDAAAYAQWAGGRLPTEAEWEYAARGGLEGANYTWGDVYDPAQGWKANTWQGRFPNEHLADDGHTGTAPVASFVPNGFGLHDMAGNVWEHVSDWWLPRHLVPEGHDPKGPDTEVAQRYANPTIGPMRVVKGGSWLCAPNFCQRYRPAGRQPAELSLGTNHIGFRVVQTLGTSTFERQ